MYLVTFMVVADLPFSFAELPEFREFVQYTRGEKIRIPSADTIKRKMKTMFDKDFDIIKERLRVSPSTLISVALLV
jgi:hypothetical protein